MERFFLFTESLITIIWNQLKCSSHAANYSTCDLLGITKFSRRALAQMLIRFLVTLS